MYIESILVENDVRFKAGLGLDKIKIVMNNKNSLNLICGNNGSGKSTLLSSLTPFADEVIEDGEQGRKKIIYRKKKSKIEIEHIYVPKVVKGKETHTVKHYIRKIKGKTKIELNENGNEATFLEAVEEELGITPDKMKLIQLGNDMTNIIKMQPSLRKQFVSKFIEDIEKYLKKGKIANDKLRTVNDLLSNYTKSLKKLGDKETHKDKLFSIKSKLLELNNIKEKLIQNIAVKNKTIEEFSNEDAIYLEKYNTIEKVQVDEEIKKMNYADIVERISDLEKIVIKNESELNINEIKKENFDSKLKELNKITSELKLVLDSMSLVELDDDYKKRIEELSSKTFSFSMSDEELVHLLNSEAAIKMYYSRAKNVLEKLEVNKSELYLEIFKSLDFMDIDVRIKVTNNTIQKNLDELTTIAAKIKTNSIELENSFDPPYDYCKNTCPMMKNKKSKSELQKIQEELSNDYNYKLKYDKKLNEYLKQLNLSKETYFIIKEAVDFELEFDKNIMKNKDKTYEKDSIIKQALMNFVSGKPIIDLSEIEKIFVIINNYKIKKANEEEKRIILEGVKNNSEYNKKLEELTEKEKEIEEIKVSYLALNKDNTIINNLINETNEKINSLKSYKEILKDMEDLEFIKNKANEYKLKLNEYNSAIEKLKEDEIDLRKINDEIDTITKEKEDISAKIKEINKLEKTKNVLDSYYQDCKMVKDSLSTNKGIPTIKIDSFMQKIRFTANEILRDCFEDSSFQFEKFNINAKEFSLPVLVNDKLVSDISKCSSGQKALGMLALSLALYEKTGTKYNIIGLDELDGPLDDVKRRNFLKTCIERFEYMGIDQIFTITHNKAFNDVDSNFILFKGAELDSINNQENIIFKVD